MNVVKLNRGRKRRPLPLGRVAGTKLTVLHAAAPIRGNSASLCRCDCGVEAVIVNGWIRKMVKDGIVAACGCGAGRAYNASLRQRAVELRNTPLTYRQIGERMGISYQRVQQLLASVGEGGYRDDIANQRKVIIPKETLKQLFDEGYGTYQCIDITGHCYKTVRNSARHHGLTPPRRDGLANAVAKYVGTRSGRLRVVSAYRGTEQRSLIWLRCLCDPTFGGCGSTHDVAVANIARTTSCGCGYRGVGARTK